MPVVFGDKEFCAASVRLYKSFSRPRLGKAYFFELGYRRDVLFGYRDYAEIAEKAFLAELIYRPEDFVAAITVDLGTAAERVGYSAAQYRELKGGNACLRERRRVGAGQTSISVSVT